MDKTLDEYLAEIDEIPIVKEGNIREWLFENYEVELIKQPCFTTYEIHNGCLQNLTGGVTTYSFADINGIKKYLDLSYIKRIYLYTIQCDHNIIWIRMFIHSKNKIIKLNKNKR